MRERDGWSLDKGVKLKQPMGGEGRSLGEREGLDLSSGNFAPFI
jgi:hypothetical protein